MTRALAPLFVTILLVAGVPAASAGPKHTVDHETITSDDGTKIAISIFKPAAAADSKVPVVLHSHGWGGSRATAVDAVKPFLNAGFGVISIDQRGHGESEGQAHVQDPKKETEDVKAVIDRAAELAWVLHNTNSAGDVVANDPVLGAIGGSYGGGYQTMTALDEIADEGRTRFDALAPEITWYDLPESLAPQKVVRSVWTALLYAVGAANVPQFVHEGFAWGSTTGQWPDGTLFGQPVPGAPDLDRVFHEHSPVAFVDKGIRINVPVLLRQGISDNLFNLNQGLKIFDKAVTDGARAQSYFIGYNGGHALPNAVPAGTAAGSDACSPDGFTRLTIDFFTRVFAGRSTDGLLPQRYNFTTADGEQCLSLARVDTGKPIDVELQGQKTFAVTVGAGAPIHVPIAKGPVTVAGIPTLKGKVTSTGLDGRAFFGLAIGATPAEAQVIQNNLMPLRQLMPAMDQRFAIELAGVAVDVPEGQSLFLTVSPVSDMYAAHGSRVPAVLVLDGLTVTLQGPNEKA